jgi:hypothetical protein
MTDLVEYSENYKALLNMCDLTTTKDVVLFRANEMEEKDMLDIIYTLKGELMMRNYVEDEE